MPEPFRKGCQMVENASAFLFFPRKVVSERSQGRSSVVAAAQLGWVLLREMAGAAVSHGMQLQHSPAALGDNRCWLFLIRTSQQAPAPGSAPLIPTRKSRKCALADQIITIRGRLQPGSGGRTVPAP